MARHHLYLNARKTTIKLLEMVDEGVISAQSLLEECLAYMSEADVADMAHRSGFLEEDPESE